MPIIEGLKKYIDEGVTSLHMPGHKNNTRSFPELNWIQDNLYKIDNTEVRGLDNLHMPGEMILEAERAASGAFKANKSYFLINGSTCGIYSMILGVTRPGDKIIVQRNCHKSVFTACLLGDLNAVYVNPSIIKGFNIALSPTSEDVIGAMDDNKDAKALVLTCPTFYGTCMDLKRITEEAHRRNILVLVDEAHGAHFYFNQRLPMGAMECGADAAVTSLHKTTPAMTQTALLNVGSIDAAGIEFMLRVFQSTSPSYVFMASMDAARHIMEDRGRELIDELLDNIEAFKKKLSKLPFYRVLGKEHREDGGFYDIDQTKLVISSPIGGVKLDEILRDKYGLQVEMSDINNIVVLTSVGNDGEVLEKLYDALVEIAGMHENFERGSIWLSETQSNRGNESSFVQGYLGNSSVISMRAACYSPKRRVRLKDAAGRISCEMVSPYPPGIPVLLPGERITPEIVELIYLYKAEGISISGLSDKSAEYIDVAEIQEGI